MDRGVGIQKSPFRTIFIVVPLLLMLLPFVNTVNEFMTRLLLHFEAYRVLEDWVVPYEAKMVASVFALFPLNVEATKTGIFLNGGLAVTFGQTVAIIFHDYFSLLLLVLWFFIFWWFCYTYVLEERVEEGE